MTCRNVTKLKHKHGVKLFPGCFELTLLAQSSRTGGVCFMIEAHSQMFPTELYLLCRLLSLLRCLVRLHFPSPGVLKEHYVIYDRYQQ